MLFEIPRILIGFYFKKYSEAEIWLC